MKFLVTGGAGFIGSNIVEELLKRGHSIRVLDNFSTGRRENLKEFENDIELIEGDIRSYHTVIHAVKGVEVILHQAALPSIPRSIKDPITTNEVNVNGTINILDAAKENNVNKIVFASSSSIYGKYLFLPLKENMYPTPISPYAISKLSGELYCKIYSQLYGLETIALRYFNVFGPRQDASSQYSAVIPKFIGTMNKDNSPIIYGDGEQSRDFTYVKNVVEANLKAANTTFNEYQVFNCASNNQFTLNFLVSQINQILGKSIRPKYTKCRSGDIKHSYASIDLITEQLNYNPKINFNEGLLKTIDAIIKK